MLTTGFTTTVVKKIKFYFVKTAKIGVQWGKR